MYTASSLYQQAKERETEKEERQKRQERTEKGEQERVEKEVTETSTGPGDETDKATEKGVAYSHKGRPASINGTVLDAASRGGDGDGECSGGGIVASCAVGEVKRTVRIKCRRALMDLTRELFRVRVC